MTPGASLHISRTRGCTAFSLKGLANDPARCLPMHAPAPCVPVETKRHLFMPERWRLRTSMDHHTLVEVLPILPCFTLFGSSVFIAVGLPEGAVSFGS